MTRGEVQRDILPILEGSSFNTKYYGVRTDHILFTTAAEFHMSKPSDLIPELQGRFPIRAELNQLTKSIFIRILQEPKTAFIAQYEALFATEGVTLTFDQDAIEDIADTAYQFNKHTEANIGARRLRTAVSHLLHEYLFDVLDKVGPRERIFVTKNTFKDRWEGLVRQKRESRGYALALGFLRCARVFVQA